MSDRIDLQAYQKKLNERFRLAESTSQRAKMLKFSTAGQSWLINMESVDRFLAVSTITTVPLTKPYYLGLTNIDGSLHGVYDFALYTGGESITIDHLSRFLVIGTKQNERSVLLVSRTDGIESVDDYRRTKIPSHHCSSTWIKEAFVNKKNELSLQIDVFALLQDYRFQFISIGDRVIIDDTLTTSSTSSLSA